MMRHSPPQVMARGDRRVQRTRTALFAAAVRLASERGTTAVAVTELADAAGVSRQVIYLQFGDRESLFAAAAMNLAEQELYPLFADLSESTLQMRTLSAAHHLARYHRFYRALVTGSCAFALKAASIRSFETLHSQTTVPVLDLMPPQDKAVASTFVVGGVMAVIDDWLLDDIDHAPDPRALARRLLRLVETFTGVSGLDDL